MEQNFIKGGREYLMFKDYYAFIQKYFIPEDNEEFWENMMNAADELWKKYDRDDFLKALNLAHIDSLEQRFKNAKGV